MLKLDAKLELAMSYVQFKHNFLIKYTSDIENYSQPDYWEIAISTGDCEDYALAKRQELIDLGYDHNDLCITLCFTETGEYHAVLTVRTDAGDYVLDNRYTKIQTLGSLNYTWDRMLIGNEWHSVKV